MADLTWIDGVLLVVLALSVAHAAWRGAIRELCALLGWGCALVAAWTLSDTVASQLPAQWAPGVRTGVAGVSLMVGVLLLFGVLGWVLSRIISAVGLGLVDRAVGAFFGLARGFLIGLLLVWLARSTSLAKTQAWEEAMVAPTYVAVLAWAQDWWPTRRVPLQFSALNQGNDGPLARE